MNDSSESEDQDSDETLFHTPITDRRELTGISFHTPVVDSSCPRNATSTPTVRGQFARFETIGNASRDLDASFDSFTGNTFTYLPGMQCRALSFSSSGGSDRDTNGSVDGWDLRDECPEPGHWRPHPQMVWKFVDDFLAGERLFIDAATQFFTTNKQQARIHAVESQLFFESVSRNAANIGMTVNDRKTQLLCLHSAIDRGVSSYIKIQGGEKIHSGDSLKQLGFYFHSKPDCERHVQELIKKVRMRSWIIRNLKKSGLDHQDLLRCYYTLVRPVLDYAVPVYHSQLTQDQSDRLEKLQRDILKTIFGFAKSYGNILEEQNIETLKERRQGLFDNFALNSAKNPEIAEKWFPKKLFEHPDLRRKRIFVEKYARTKRLYQSPLYTMRRRLNEISPVEFE